MKTLSIALALLLAGVLGALIAGAAVLLRGGISAKVEPTHLESVIARRLLPLGIPDASRRLRNPEPSSKEVLAAGRAHFADHCAICHGNDGGGQTEMGRNLYPRVPDLRLPHTQQLTDGELFYIIENGIRLTGMPGWGDGSEASGRAGIAVEQQRKAQAEVLRHIPCGARAAAHLHRQDDEWPARESGSQPLDAGQLVAARLAPGRPEIHQDHLPPIIGEAVRRTVRIAELQRRRRREQRGDEQRHQTSRAVMVYLNRSGSS